MKSASVRELPDMLAFRDLVVVPTVPKLAAGCRCVDHIRTEVLHVSIRFIRNFSCQFFVINVSDLHSITQFRYFPPVSHKMAHVGALPKVHRYITTHDPSTGKAVFSTEIADEPPIDKVETMGFMQAYVTKGFPVDLDSEADIKTYNTYITNSPGLTVKGGTVCRFVDFSPGMTCAMHRTVSLDYGVVIMGQIEAILDSGETRVIGPSDVCVQRGTMHAWRNTSETEWCRMMFVLQESKELNLGQGKLGEDLGTSKETIKAST